MAGERVKLSVSERTNLGSAESRRLRRQGLIPGVVYGRSKPVAISVGERDLRGALTTAAGGHAVIELSIGEGRSHSVILKDFQRDKVRGQIIHVDLQEVRLDQPIQTTVSVTLTGDAPGVREGGVLSQAVTDVAVEALPLEVPQHLEADVSGLGIGDSLHLRDVVLPDGVTLLDDADTVLASVGHAVRPEDLISDGEAAAGEEQEGAGEAAASDEETSAEG